MDKKIEAAIDILCEVQNELAIKHKNSQIKSCEEYANLNILNRVIYELKEKWEWGLSDAQNA